ncbi:MAG: heavy metal translocating P-type ATPase [Tahibacter sp.]
MNEALCFHCSESIPDSVVLSAMHGGKSHRVCCIGCAAAVEWIVDLGLADYYRLRNEPASRARSRLADYSIWDKPGFSALYSRHDDDVAEACVLVEGLRCPACSWLIERALRSLEGVHDVSINVLARRLVVRWNPARIRLSNILTALARLGYVPHPLQAAALDAVSQREQRDALKRLSVAGLGMMQAMMYAVALYAGAFNDMDDNTRDFFRWLGFIVTTPVVLYSAQGFFAGAWRALRAGRLSMDLPVAAAIALVYVASLVEALRGGGQVYFDSAAMFVFFLLAGRYLQMRARHHAGDTVDALARLQPALAQRRCGDGRYEQIGVHELRVGDVVQVSVGDAIPADGELLSAQCFVDEAMLSGESEPVLRGRGAHLLAGSFVTEGPADLRVRAVGAATVLSSMLRLVARAGSEKPRAAIAGERDAARFVAVLLTLTALTTIVWSVIDPTRAFPAALAVLVVACPCAFALAVPVALTRALTILARRGVLVVRADALETLPQVSCVLFDKTGTLTDVNASSVQVQTREGTSAAEALACAAALEGGSRHPFAEALRVAATGLPTRSAASLVQHPGAGVTGTVAGVALRLGRSTFAIGDEAEDTSALVLADSHGEVARFQIGEHLRESALSTLSGLRTLGTRVEILSGDAPTRVAVVAAALQVTNWRARQSPPEKLAHLAHLRQSGECVAMVGDGVNDAAILAGADIGIAMASASDLAQARADIVLAGNDLTGLLLAESVARQTRRIMRQNLHWSMAYNVAAIPLAAFGMVPPWLAAIGMSASSILVILNSLRIRIDPPLPLMTSNRVAIA